VTVVIALLLAASIPRFAHTAQRLRVERVAFELTRLLRFAHERAVTQGREVAWAWETPAQRAILHEQLPTDDDADPTWRPVPSSRSVPLAGDASLHVTYEQEPLGCPEAVAGTSCVRFFPDGTSESSTVTLVVGGQRYTATVDATTGRVVLAAGTPAR
jgi:Tfp pilus assembly protein FimT